MITASLTGLSTQRATRPITTPAQVTIDANGNVCDLTGTTGSTVAHYEYTPFGSVAASTGALKDANPWQFSSKYYDAETQLKYYGYRYLANGHWLNRDPLGERGGLMLYVFALNGPIDLFDILGREAGLTGDDELDALLGDELDALMKAIEDELKDISNATTCLALDVADASLIIMGVGVKATEGLVDFIMIVPPGVSWNFPPSLVVVIPTPNGPYPIDVGALLTTIEKTGPALKLACQNLDKAIDKGRDAIATKKEELCCDE